MRICSFDSIISFVDFFIPKLSCFYYTIRIRLVHYLQFVFAIIRFLSIEVIPTDVLDFVSYLVFASVCYGNECLSLSEFKLFFYFQHEDL